MILPCSPRRTSPANTLTKARSQSLLTGVVELEKSNVDEENGNSTPSAEQDGEAVDSKEETGGVNETGTTSTLSSDKSNNLRPLTGVDDEEEELPQDDIPKVSKSNHWTANNLEHEIEEEDQIDEDAPVPTWLLFAELPRKGRVFSIVNKDEDDDDGLWSRHLIAPRTSDHSAAQPDLTNDGARPGSTINATRPGSTNETARPGLQRTAGLPRNQAWRRASSIRIPTTTTFPISSHSNYGRGSVTGLTELSQRATQWVHRVPKWASPIFPGIFNFTNALCRMLALAYIPASVAEILNNGLELVFSVVAARVVRKRTILPQRWLGVGVVVLGLSWVGISDFVGSRKGGFADSSPRSVLVGLACVFGQVFSGVLRVISEELFIHETNIPASLLLGLEGCIGLVIGIPLYFAVAPLVGQELGEDFREVLPAIGENTGYIIYTLFLVLVFFVASLFQILSTGVTSSMTRNVWKNFRGLLVWIIGIIPNYSSDGGFGEPFNIPGSLMLLGGFSLMMLGLFIYYRKETFKCNCNRPFRRCEEEHSIEYSC